MATSIWRDTYYTKSADTFNYTITDGEKTIFSGKAYRYPDDANIKINVSKICRNHLDSIIPISIFSNNSGSIQLPNAVKTFYLYDSAGTQQASYQFCNDWSYADTNKYSDKINAKYDTNMYCLATNSSYVVSYSRSGGNGYNVKGCGDYALYYSNSYGGWDSFLIEGKVVESKNITNHSYRKDVDNTTINREEIRYQSDIQSNWVLNTGWLTDEESKRLYDNLLISNNVYLHNLITDKIVPVSIQDSSVTNKQFKNEKKLITYTINVKEDNIRLCR